MARDFDGTDDNIQTIANAVPGMDSATVTYFMRANVDAISGGADIVCEPSANASKGQFRKQIIFRDPVTSGFRFEFEQRATGGGAVNGIWISPDISLDVFHDLCVTYDGTDFVNNDPVMYVDGSSVTVTETQTPAGNRHTSEDSLVWGSRWDGTLAADCGLADCAGWDVVLTANEVAALSRGLSPFKVRPGNLQSWVPMWGLHSPELGFGLSPTTYTVTGAVLINHPPITPYSQQFAWGTVPLIEVAAPGANRLLLINPPGLDGGFGTGLSL